MIRLYFMILILLFNLFLSPLVWALGSKNVQKGPHMDLKLDPSVLNLQPSPTLEAQYAVEVRKKNGLPVYNWGLGANPLEPPQSIYDAVRDHAHEKYYGSPRGVEELAELIAKRYSIPDVYPLSKDDVLVAPGLKQIIYDVQKSFGGKIIHVTPYWVSYAEQTQLLGKTPLLVKTTEKSDYKLTPKHVHQIAKEAPNEPKLIIFNHPTNPSGAAYSREELIALAEAFREHGIFVFADEVYLGNHFEGHRNSLAQFYPERTIRATSLSKEFGLGGYRLGWVTFPPQMQSLRNAVLAVGTAAYSCAPIPLQYAAIQALKGEQTIDMFVKQSQIIFKVLAHNIHQRVRQMGIDSIEPQAAWYLLFDFTPLRYHKKLTKIKNSVELSKHLVEELGMIFVPGSAFGFEPEKLILRASLVDIDPQGAQDWVRSIDLQDQQLSPEQIVKKHPLKDLAWARKVETSLTMLGQWLAEK